MEEKKVFSAQDWEQAAQIAALSHEFKTPLSVTLATVDLVQRKMHQQTGFYTDEYEMLFGIAKRNLYKMLRMSNNFTDADRLASGVVTLHFYDEDVTRILRQLEESVAPMLKSRGARINFICKAHDPFCAECDAQAIDRILLNLISNSIKHLPQQNGRILLVLEAQSAQGEPDMLCISVTDNGCGIQDEALPHLFERYWHDESENSVDKTGTGLGLYLVKALVEMHGGTVSVQSEPHMATTFSVALPVRQPQSKSNGVLRSSTMSYDADMHAQLLRLELSDFL